MITVQVNSSSARIQSDHSTSCVSLLTKLCSLTFVSNSIAPSGYELMFTSLPTGCSIYHRVPLLEQQDRHDFDGLRFDLSCMWTVSRTFACRTACTTKNELSFVLFGAVLA